MAEKTRASSWDAPRERTLAQLYDDLASRMGAAVEALLKQTGDEDDVTTKGIQTLNGNIKPLQPDEVQVAKAALKEFALAQYAETQDRTRPVSAA